jgi:glutamyl aminopeptidase
MACTKQPWLISRYLNDQINSTKVRLQDSAAGLSRIAATSYGNLRTWTFIKDNWDELISKFVCD